MSLSRRKLISRTALGGLVLAASGRWTLPAFAGDTIKIGAPFNMTGAVASLDAPAANGAKLKAQEINDAGGVLGKKIELVTYDTKTDPTVIASTGSRLVNEDKVSVIIGFTDSDSVLALGPIAEKAGIPFVTPGATSPKLPEQVGKNMFLACFGDNV
ncbi:MAG: branched-chain amino acid transport system substrate-binding protein, partial [Rhodospirillaceae bacterium]|nr:branched-chain amino acid transport system substrate-binding protein [Rhodospirillaceae bacterium]